MTNRIAHNALTPNSALSKAVMDIAKMITTPTITDADLTYFVDRYFDNPFDPTRDLKIAIVTTMIRSRYPRP